MITLPSGVICGFTLSARFALRKLTEVAPDEVACWYGISVPCSINASAWLAVSTRGLAMILPLPSDSSAEISRLRNRVRALLNSRKLSDPALNAFRPAAGKLVLRPGRRPERVQRRV